MTVLAAWATNSGASRLSPTIDVENRADAVAVSAGGEPPALLTATSRRPYRSTTRSTSAATWSASRTSAAENMAVLPEPDGTASGSWRPHITTLGAGVEEPFGDAPADAPARRP